MTGHDGKFSSPGREAPPKGLKMKNESHKGFSVGDVVVVTDYDGTESEPVAIASLWGTGGEATLAERVHGCLYWNVETFRKAV